MCSPSDPFLPPLPVHFGARGSTQLYEGILGGSWGFLGVPALGTIALACILEGFQVGGRVLYNTIFLELHLQILPASRYNPFCTATPSSEFYGGPGEIQWKFNNWAGTLGIP